MKFLAIKSAFEAIAKPVEQKKIDTAQSETPPKFPYKTKELIAGGDIKWKPIDKQAAMLLSKANWLSKPNAVPMNQKEAEQLEQSVNDIIRPKGKEVGSRLVSDITEIVDSHATFTDNVVKGAIKRTEKVVTETEDLLERAKDARAALDDLCDSWKAKWFDFMKESDNRARELRMTRMAIENETRLVMAQFKDVRSFFLDEKHDAEVKRLNEFVTLCERLKTLKDSGFLDTVADTILKL